MPRLDLQAWDRYFGNDTAGSIDYSTFISTYDDGTNPQHYQQQVVATIAIP